MPWICFSLGSATSYFYIQRISSYTVMIVIRDVPILVLDMGANPGISGYWLQVSDTDPVPVLALNIFKAKLLLS